MCRRGTDAPARGHSGHTRGASAASVNDKRHRSVVDLASHHTSSYKTSPAQSTMVIKKHQSLEPQEMITVGNCKSGQTLT